MDDFGHWQCETCSRTFRSQHAANQHMNVKDHWPGCERCDRRFGTLRASRQHMRDKDHWPEYETCDREVMTQSAFDINMDDDDHWPRCETCSLAFHNQSECDEHMDREDHWKNYCKQCELHCRDESSFRAVSVQAFRMHRFDSVVDSKLPAQTLSLPYRSTYPVSQLREHVHYSDWSVTPPRDGLVRLRALSEQKKYIPRNRQTRSLSVHHHQDVRSDLQESRSERCSSSHRQCLQRIRLGVRHMPADFRDQPGLVTAYHLARSSAESVSLPQ